MSLKPAKVQFNGGELSPWLEARIDINKFDKTARLCRNFIPVAEGSLKRRGGTRFVAFTLEDEELSFKINAVPMDAEIIINGCYCSNIKVARGEWVSYEVKASGYASKVGKVYIEEDMELDVELISLGEMCEIVINAKPEGAIVKIEGYERIRASFYKNSEVYYMVMCEGYETKTGIVKLLEDMVIDVELEKVEVEEYNGNYGDWGRPLEFVSCSAVFNLEVRKKCILVRFENGYLAIVFSADKKGPEAEEIENRLFFYEQRDGGNSVAEKKGETILCNLRAISDAVLYYDLDGKIVAGVSVLEQKTFGWQVDENRKYATFYKTYSGSVVENVVKIFYKDEVVLVLEGRF